MAQISGWRRGLGSSNMPLAPQAASSMQATRLAAPAPVARSVGLQVIADVNGMAFGYELLYRPPGRRDAGPVADNRRATCEVLLAAVLDLGLPRKAAGLSFFVNVDHELLMSPLVEVITPDWGVIELLESIVATPAVVRRVHELRQRGMRFALDDVEGLNDSRWALIPDIEVVKIDWRRTRFAELPQMMAHARLHGARMLAEKVEDANEAASARALGFDLLQGYGIAVPDVIQAPGLPACMPLVLRRLRLLLQHGASCEALATALASDPATVLRVIQVAEQAGVRTRSADRPERLSALIGDVPRAVLQAWLMVLEAADVGPVDQDWTYAGLVQSRVMKVLARRVSPDQLEFADEAYLLGLLDHFGNTLGILHRQLDRGALSSVRLDAARDGRQGLLAALLEFSRSQFRQPSGWLPGPLSVVPGLALALPAVYREAHLWARERSLHGAGANGRLAQLPMDIQPRPCLMADAPSRPAMHDLDQRVSRRR